MKEAVSLQGASNAVDVVGEYYDRKTNQILDKYGASVRVHYHTGISDGRYRQDDGPEQLRWHMHMAQERVLELLSGHFPSSLQSCRLLEVGCGLGGGALYWAMERGAQVTAITIAGQHLGIVRRAAQIAGVSRLVDALEQDAHSMPGRGLFDAAVAIESSCYLDRYRWLERVSHLLKPGGILQIFDWMAGSEESRGSDRMQAIEAHWCTNLGTPAEYRDAAAEVGLSLLHEEQLNDAVVGFWTLAIAWNEAAARTRAIPSDERDRLTRSSEEIAGLQACFRSEEILSQHFVFEKPR